MYFDNCSIDELNASMINSPQRLRFKRLLFWDPQYWISTKKTKAILQDISCCGSRQWGANSSMWREEVGKSVIIQL